MKQIVFGVVSSMILVLTLMILLTVHGRSLRQTEADHALTEAVDAAMSDLLEERRQAPASGETFVAEFLQILLSQINSTSDIRVDILDADENMGILSVEVTETYRHPNGKTGSVSAVRTVILDRKKQEVPVFYTVEFYTADQELYKRYTLPENSLCSIPAPPQKPGKEFDCWRFVEGGYGVLQTVQVPLQSSGSSGTREVLAVDGEPYPVTENIRLIGVFSKGEEGNEADETNHGRAYPPVSYSAYSHGGYAGKNENKAGTGGSN